MEQQTLPDLTGPVRPPLSGAAAKQLVVFLHGLGADGQDLISIADAWWQELPDAAFISPNAPYPCDMAPYGFQWFSLQDRSPENIEAGIEQAAPVLDAFLDRQLAHYGLDDSALALVGFSQGTMMALYTAPRRQKCCAGVIGYSGALFGAQGLKEAGIQHPPVLLVHGDSDMVVPPAALPDAEKKLSDAGFNVDANIHKGLAHGIDPEGVAKGLIFLKGVFSSSRSGAS